VALQPHITNHKKEVTISTHLTNLIMPWGRQYHDGAQNNGNEIKKKLLYWSFDQINYDLITAIPWWCTKIENKNKKMVKKKH